MLSVSENTALNKNIACTMNDSLALNGANPINCNEGLEQSNKTVLEGMTASAVENMHSKLSGYEITKLNEIHTNGSDEKVPKQKTSRCFRETVMDIKTESTVYEIKSEPLESSTAIIVDCKLALRKAISGAALDEFNTQLHIPPSPETKKEPNTCVTCISGKIESNLSDGNEIKPVESEWRNIRICNHGNNKPIMANHTDSNKHTISSGEDKTLTEVENVEMNEKEAFTNEMQANKIDSNEMDLNEDDHTDETFDDETLPMQTEGKFTCHICYKSFSQSCNLKKHMFLHTGERPFSCEICNKRFSQAAHLKTHSRSHTGEKPYRCDTCGKHFGQSSNLKTHLRTHLSEKPFICLFCEKMFTREEHVKNHMRIHTGEKPFTCDICEKEFTQEAHLKRHVRTHTGEKPYICPVCDKGFTEDGTLKVHMRIHTGETPFVCRFCGKGFRDSSNLRRHIGSHTGERAFICQVCDKKYAKKVTLRKHIATHHSNLTEESAVDRLIATVVSKEFDENIETMTEAGEVSAGGDITDTSTEDAENSLMMHNGDEQEEENSPDEMEMTEKTHETSEHVKPPGETMTTQHQEELSKQVPLLGTDVMIKIKQEVVDSD